MAERKPTLAYGTVQRRRYWTTDVTIFAVLVGAFILVCWACWYFGIKPDLDKGM